MKGKQTDKSLLAPESVRDSESRQTKPFFFNSLNTLSLLGFLTAMILFTSCDNQLTEPESVLSLTPVEQFFSFNPDSVGPFLTIAIDTLQERQPRTPFVEEFIQTKGLPVWDAHSAFYSKGRPVLLVPVRDTDEPKITGIIYISGDRNQPIYRWVPRGAVLEHPDLPGPKQLETFMLMYEKMVFGRVQTQGVTVQTQTFYEQHEVENPAIAKDDWVWIKVTHHCGNVSANGGRSFGPDQCEVDYYWVRLDGHTNGRPGLGGNPGGPGGGSGSCTFGCGPAGSNPVPGAEMLKNFLEQNEYGLLDIPCEEIPKWQKVAQFEPPQEVIDKINELGKGHFSYFIGDWDIQYIEEAAGTLINMDYFPVTVNKLPVNPNTGHRFSANGFLEYIRTNLDDFFTGNSTEFGPYNNAERQIWLSDDYLGAIMRFDI